jgi:hypothetical protein
MMTREAMMPLGANPHYRDLLRRQGRPVAAMPEDDPVIAATDPALRKVIGETWLRRAHEELKASMGFAVLAQKLLEVGAAPEAMARVARAVGDEARHAEICRALAERYLGEEAPWPGAVPVDLGGAWRGLAHSRVAPRGDHGLRE